MIRLFSVNVVWTYLLNHSFTTNVLIKIMKVFTTIVFVKIMKVLYKHR